MRDPEAIAGLVACLPSAGTRVTLHGSGTVTILVDDLARSMNYYRRLGFTFDEPWEEFYAIGQLDGFELHLKEAPGNSPERQRRRENEHLDAAAGVNGIEAFYERCVATGVSIFRPLEGTAWGTKNFYVEDPDGHIIAFGGRPF